MSKDKVKEKDTATEKMSGRSKALTVVGIIICVLLVPILVVNVTMIIKSYTNPDEYPSFAGYNLMIVLSPSMEDTIMTGDLIVVKNADPDEVKGESAAGAQDGDIISFFDPDSSKQSVLTHRCKNVNDDDTFTTKGDNNIDADPTPCPTDNLIGKYVMRIPGAGSVAMWLQTTPGLIVCVAVPIVLLVLYDLIMKKRYDKKKKTDTDDLLAELESLRAQQAEAEGKAEAKAEAAENKAEEAQAKSDKPEKKPEAEKTDGKKDAEPEKAEEKPAVKEEKPAEEKAEKPAEEKSEASGDNSVTTTMSAEELEEFRQFREFQKMKKAQQEEAKKNSDSQDEE